VPLNREPLPLEPDPGSVRKARAWLRDVLSNLEREDIVSAAELAASELVTNAILHGAPPITIRVRGTRDHPRVEIRDASTRPPQVNVEMADEENLLTTFGRGLGLVALHSNAWGAELTYDGKVVWFEPTDEPSVDGDLTGEVFDLDQTVQERVAGSGLSDDAIGVRIVDVPVTLYQRFRRRYYELGRELRLLSLSHGHTYPVAGELADVFLQAEQERRLSRGIEAAERALPSAGDRLTFELLVPPSAPATMARLREALERADQFCREQRLLVLAATPQELALQRWYLGEYIRQAAGEDPLPWPGPFTVDDTMTVL
jgi:anti-sigma regulatory factor (Ser/Thr protein kinase)